MNKCTLMYNLCLAVADAFHKAKYFVLGCPDLLIATDHKYFLNATAIDDHNADCKLLILVLWNLKT
jgi:hypothetical protein